MKDFRFYLFPVLLIINIIAFMIIYPIQMVFSFIFLGVFVYMTIDWVYLFLSYTWWPYHKWISSNVVNIEEVEISSAIEGEKLQAVLIRPKNMDKTQKHVGVLFHHGYTGKKEKVFRFAFPLAMEGCVVLCPDARGHGESKNKAFNMNDFKGILEDVSKEIDFLANLPEVDSEKLAMMGHSMGGISPP
ncbi:MAG: alpha/beta fold hydrolase [Promethearchaeota archaeon]|nr:MAG: alpha/beta fold hydrolase [Candidatus Lokiarchaeota archaeon]